jgi:FixJ family two-component response regulator
VIILDLFMPHVSGQELLPRLTREYPEIPVVVMTASQEVETAVSCMKEGAFDYLVKPVEESCSSPPCDAPWRSACCARRSAPSGPA